MPFAPFLLFWKGLAQVNVVLVLSFPFPRDCTSRSAGFSFVGPPSASPDKSAAGPRPIARARGRAAGAEDFSSSSLFPRTRGYAVHSFFFLPSVLRVESGESPVLFGGTTEAAEEGLLTLSDGKCFVVVAGGWGATKKT